MLSLISTESIHIYYLQFSIHFYTSRDCIPNVPCDTKLSKIKTLRLATSYIDYLINVLKSDDPKLAAEGFKADVHKKWNDKSDEQKRKELVSWE